MNKIISPELKEVMGVTQYLPCVSLIMPFDPKMNLKTELTHKLKITVDKIEHQLLENYEHEKAIIVTGRLRNLLNNLNYDTYKKSIALYVSPIFEKVYYLDIPVEEKIIIDESFEIRDLVYNKKDLHNYLVLLLSSEWTKVYMGNANEFVRVKTATPDNVNAIWNDVPSKTANFTDPSYRKEVMLNKFLKYSDDGLSMMLKSTPYPVFVMGTDRTIGHYKKITENNRHIAEYIHGNYEEATEADIKTVLAPYLLNWKKVKYENILHQLDGAMSAGKLVTGVENVWQEVSRKNCQLLVVEKNFVFAAQKVSETEIIPFTKIGENSMFIKDAVDDIIEKILLSGGDVEFADEKLPADYNHIALIKYY